MTPTSALEQLIVKVLTQKTTDKKAVITTTVSKRAHSYRRCHSNRQLKGLNGIAMASAACCTC
jgi:hypothetical protein